MTELEKKLPPYYKKSRYVQGLCSANDKEFDRLYDRIQKYENNRLIDTADEDGIKQRENDLNIVPGKTDTLEDRRIRVKARKKGMQPLSPSQLKSIIEDYGLQVAIEEHIPEYTFDVVFISPATIPLEAIRELVEELKLAHLAVNYIIRNTYDSGLFFTGRTISANDSIIIESE